MSWQLLTTAYRYKVNVSLDLKIKNTSILELICELKMEIFQTLNEKLLKKLYS